MVPRGKWMGAVLATLAAALPAPSVRAEDDSGGAVSTHDAAATARLATALDLGVYLGIATIFYVVDDTNEDQEYAWSFDTLRHKFVTRDALRFDDNPLMLNTPGHVLAGTLYVVAARTHGASTLEAFAAATAASTIWELLPEYREVLSLNDLIMTPVGGLAFGEPIHQLGEFFRRSQPRWLNQILGTVLMGPSPLFPWNGLEARHVGGGLEAHARPADMWGRVHAGVGAQLFRSTAGPRAQVSGLLDLHARTVDVAGYGRAESSTSPEWSARTLRSELRVRLVARPAGLDEVWLLGEAMWAGAHGGLRGVQWLAGPGALYEHREHSVASGGDRLGSVSPAGVMAHVAVHLGAPKLRLDASVHPVLAAVHSHAWPEAAGESALSAPDVLWRRGYYFATGARGAGAVELDWGGLRLRAAARAYALSSAEWMEVPGRASEMPLSDLRLAWEASLAQRLPLPSTFARIVLEQEAGWSRADGASTSRRHPSLALLVEHEL